MRVAQRTSAEDAEGSLAQVSTVRIWFMTATGACGTAAGRRNRERLALLSGLRGLGPRCLAGQPRPPVPGAGLASIVRHRHGCPGSTTGCRRTRCPRRASSGPEARGCRTARDHGGLPRGRACGGEVPVASAMTASPPHREPAFRACRGGAAAGACSDRGCPRCARLCTPTSSREMPRRVFAWRPASDSWWPWS